MSSSASIAMKHKTWNTKPPKNNLWRKSENTNTIFNKNYLKNEK